VADETVLGLIETRLQMGDAKSGFILDGFPRTSMQANGLKRILGEQKIDRVVNLVVPAEVVVSRLKDRWLCGSCGAIYNTKTAPPKQPGICDRCGASLKQRPDDEPATVRARLEVYESETAPLVAYYRRDGVLRDVDGTGPAPKVYAELERAIGKAVA
jgi:adenylate kinase